MEVEVTALDVHKVSITVMAAVLPMWKQLYHNLDKIKQCKKKKKKSLTQKNIEGRNKDTETLRCWD